jgi:hypothetical protein
MGISHSNNANYIQFIENKYQQQEPNIKELIDKIRHLVKHGFEDGSTFAQFSQNHNHQYVQIDGIEGNLYFEAIKHANIINEFFPLPPGACIRSGMDTTYPAAGFHYYFIHFYKAIHVPSRHKNDWSNCVKYWSIDHKNRHASESLISSNYVRTVMTKLNITKQDLIGATKMEEELKSNPKLAESQLLLNYFNKTKEEPLLK